MELPEEGLSYVNRFFEIIDCIQNEILQCSKDPQSFLYMLPPKLLTRIVDIVTWGCIGHFAFGGAPVESAGDLKNLVKNR